MPNYPLKFGILKNSCKFNADFKNKYFLILNIFIIMRNILSLLCVFGIALTFVACSPTSVKGKWTDADKKEVRDGFIGEAKKRLAASGQTLDDASLEKIADCFASKVEAEFEGTDAYNAGLDKRKEIGNGCANEVMGAASSQGETPTEEPAATDTTKTEQ